MMDPKSEKVIAMMHTDEARTTMRAILEGKLDEDLALIARNAEYRTKWLARRTFPIGTRVKIVNAHNPELEGLTGTVVKYNPKRLGVFLDRDWAEWMGAREQMSLHDMRDFVGVNVPPSMLESVQ